jgi:signal transduction histidine kinase
LRRLRIGPRLTLSFAVIILLMFLGTAVGLWQFTVVQTQADLVTDAIADEQAAALENMHQAQQQAYTTILVTGALALLAAAVLGVAVTRSIAEPLAQLDSAAKALARRQFYHRPVVSGNDELTTVSQAFNDAASQLAELYADLEALVQQRTQELQQSTQELHHRYLQLETGIAVGHRITSILDLDTLLQQVVELIKERYGYYFVGILLLDDSGEYVTVRAGTGEPGHILREQGFRLKAGEEGIIGWVAKHRRAARVNDVSQDSRYLHLDLIPDTRSELVLPLVMGGTMLGVLDIQSDQLKTFDMDDVPILQSLADQVAIAIKNASLYQSEKSGRQVAEILYNAGRAISSTLDLREVLELILAHLAEIVPYDRAAVMLENRDEMEIVAARGFPADVDPFSLRVKIKEDDIFQQICQTQQPLLILDVSQRPDWQYLVGLPRAKVWLGLPLIRFDKVMGMLSLTREVATPYEEDEITLAATFTGQAAIALENARLYDKITRFTQQLEDMVRERTEAVQAAYADLEHLDQAKTDFINVTAHELRTPLTILRGYSQMLLKDKAIQENAHHQELISMINSGAVRLHGIVNSLLDITKIDNRALDLYPEPLTVALLVELVFQRLEDALAERNLTLTVENLNDLPNIEADPDALEKVFYHLIVNAVKYTPDGGTITVGGRAIETNQGPPGVEIVISDTGIGIDPDYHRLIFTKFYQTGELALHSSGKTKFKGAGPGLGLAIVQGIVEAHRGRVWVESPGCDEESCPGSQFFVFLPLRQRKGTSPGDQSTGRQSFGSVIGTEHRSTFTRN